MALVGWFMTFIAIYSTTQLVLQLTLEAAGVNTVVVGSTAGDEKNPVGQIFSILGALAVGLGGTFLLYRWYKLRSRELAHTTTRPVDSPTERSGVEA